MKTGRIEGRRKMASEKESGHREQRGKETMVPEAERDKEAKEEEPEVLGAILSLNFSLPQFISKS